MNKIQIKKRLWDAQWKAFIKYICQKKKTYKIDVKSMTSANEMRVKTQL